MQTAFQECFAYVNHHVHTQQQWSISDHLVSANELKVSSIMKSLTVQTEGVRDCEGLMGASSGTERPRTLAFPNQATRMRVCWPC